MNDTDYRFKVVESNTTIFKTVTAPLISQGIKNTNFSSIRVGDLTNHESYFHGLSIDRYFVVGRFVGNAQSEIYSTALRR